MLIWKIKQKSSDTNFKDYPTILYPLFYFIKLSLWVGRFQFFSHYCNVWHLENLLDIFSWGKQPLYSTVPSTAIDPFLALTSSTKWWKLGSWLCNKYLFFICASTTSYKTWGYRVILFQIIPHGTWLARTAWLRDCAT